MPSNTLSRLLLATAAIAFASCSESSKNSNTQAEAYTNQAPTNFTVDPSWPKELPNSWILGEVAGIATDANDHVWIIQRPATLDERETGATQNPPKAECCAPAPSVIEFDPDGNVVQAWGNPDSTKRWITTEHGIYVDKDNNVWVGGSFNDHVVMKFSNSGKLLLQIGELGKTNGSNDTLLLGAPADITVDAEANEVYIADGYVNRRIIVFDATTGKYKRHWGAYGEAPNDEEPPVYNPSDPPVKTFRGPVHAVRISNDNLVYVADRRENRIQVFQKDGTFVTEAFISKQTLDFGSVWDLELSPDPAQTYVYVADGMNMKVWVLERSSLEVKGSFGHGGRNAGQFGWVHNVAMDSKGNLYTAEVRPGKRIQKFRPVGDR
ncbi:MAG: hypothetical protein R2820_03960 [Cyclobacteriaceae bacterium]